MPDYGVDPPICVRCENEYILDAYDSPVGKYCDQCAHARVDELEAQIDRVEQTIEGFCGSVESAAANFRRPKGGQHVGFHGDFANITPSTLSRLEWWARALRKAINHE
jgi:hypothetical protein